MKGLSFEYHCKTLLENNGYTDVTLTPATGDYGIDVIAHMDGIKIGIQCKEYSSPVGNSSVQEAYSGAKYYHCDRAIVLTNNVFTQPAQILAISTGVELWDGKMLSKLEKSSKVINRELLQSFLIEAKKKFSKEYCCLCGYNVLGGPIYLADSTGPKFFNSKVEYDSYIKKLVSSESESDYMFYTVYNN